MRKQLKLLLLVATVLALFVMAMIVGSADGNVCKNTTTGTEYADFLAACTAAQSGDTIQLLADVTVTANGTALTEGTEITIDGAYGEDGRYKLTINSTSKNLFQVATANVNITFKNLVIDVKNTKAKYGIVGGSTKSANLGVALDNCDITCQNAGVFRSGRMIISFNDCDIEAPNYVVLNNNHTQYQTNITITGDTKVNITGGTAGFASGNGCNLTIGAQGQNNDEIEINVPATLLTVADPATPVNDDEEQTGSLTVWGGTIKATGSGTAGMIVANSNAVNIYGGTFELSNSGMYLFSSAAGITGTINIAGGTFVLSGGANFTDTAKLPVASFSTSATTLGDITFKLGAGSADSAAVQEVLNNATLWSKAKFYITSWPGVNVVENPTITTAGTYNQAQFEALFVEGEAIADPIPTYTALGTFFVQGTNLFLDEGYAKTEIVYNTVTVNVNGTVTLKDVTFAASAGTWIEIVKGTLVLDNCNITVAEDASVTYFVFSEADGVTLEVTGGSYDMTKTSVDKPVPFKIGVRNKYRTETSSTENTVVSFENTSIYSKGSYVLGIEYIKSLTITNCFLSYTNAIAKGGIDSVTDEALLEGSNNGILTDAITTTISNTVIYAGNGTIAIQGRADTTPEGLTYTKPTVSLTNVTIYADRGINYSVGAVNLTNCHFKAHPGDDRHISIQLNGAVTMTVVGGSFAQNETLTNKANSMFEFRAAGATLNISGATINAYVGNVFNFAEAGTLIAENCNIAVNGTEQSIVNDTTAETAKVTLTECMFVVENVQETTVEEETTKIALFVGKVDFVDVVVLAKAGTKVQGTYELDGYAQRVRYDTKEYKLWTADAGDFTNSAEAGAGINEEHHGLKFDTEISSTVINGFIAEKTSKGIKDIRFYTLVAPMDYVAKAGGVFTKDALDTALGIGNTNYVAIEAVHSLLGFDAETNATTADSVKYAGTLIELNSDTRIYAAVSMIVFEYTDDTTDTFYGDFCSADNARTYNQVVAAAAN
ncbi:MAG: hypothetical protein IKA06_05255 [Clostridia bacterium]|nr:hypothetical protein [Clostridia bacterium]